jgi:hypothetical protein
MAECAPGNGPGSVVHGSHSSLLPAFSGKPALSLNVIRVFTHAGPNIAPKAL